MNANKNLHALAAEYQRAIGETPPTMPKMLTHGQFEKIRQMVNAVIADLALADENEDYAEIGFQLSNAIFILFRTANAYGMGGFIYKIISETHKTNMSVAAPKLKFKNGKQVHPRGWKKPNVQKIIDDYINNFTNYRVEF